MNGMDTQICIRDHLCLIYDEQRWSQCYAWEEDSDFWFLCAVPQLLNAKNNPYWIWLAEHSKISSSTVFTNLSIAEGIKYAVQCLYIIVYIHLIVVLFPEY